MHKQQLLNIIPTTALLFKNDTQMCDTCCKSLHQITMQLLIYMVTDLPARKIDNLKLNIIFAYFYRK
jgi:hypothetical protein